MADKINTSLLAADPNAPGAPRIASMTETGYGGLRVAHKQIQEEELRDWRMPNRIKTVNDMKQDAVISAAIQFYTVYLAEATHKIVPPEGDKSRKKKEEAKFVESVFNDMDESFHDTFVSILSYLQYGFSVHEIVGKRRLRGKSKHDDGFVGLAGLKPRAQSTISGWIFSPDGRKLTGVEQSLQNMQYGERYAGIAPGGYIPLPIEKLAIFSSMPVNGNPEGTSLLRGAYQAWRYKRTIEDAEIAGVARDLQGLLVMTIPSDYLSPYATADKVAAAEDAKRAGRNISVGDQNFMLLPSDMDESGKGKAWSVELLSSSGAKAYDTNKIISRWDSRILLSMFTDILQVGNEGTGTQSMIEGKTELVEIGLQYRLKEIESVFNKTIIPWIYAQNKWDASNCVQLKFDPIAKPSWDSVGKMVQRVLSVGGMEKDREFYNLIRKYFGLSQYPEEEPVHEELVGEAESRSGDGMEVGVTGEGTAKKPGGGDKSSGNAENGE